MKWTERRVFVVWGCAMLAKAAIESVDVAAHDDASHTTRRRCSRLVDFCFVLGEG
jgi:hypothetical protein